MILLKGSLTKAFKNQLHGESNEENLFFSTVKLTSKGNKF